MWHGRKQQFLVPLLAILFFGNFKVKANLVMQQQKLAKKCLVDFPMALKDVILNDLEMPFSVKNLFRAWIFLPLLRRQLYEND